MSMSETLILNILKALNIEPERIMGEVDKIRQIGTVLADRLHGIEAMQKEILALLKPGDNDEILRLASRKTNSGDQADAAKSERHAGNSGADSGGKGALSVQSDQSRVL